jgi:hypothetical protein
MVVIRRIAIAIEWLAIALFVALAVLLPMDLISAFNASPCSERKSLNCYPWGKNLEGPLAGAGWSYESRENYLTSGWLLEIVLIGMLAAAFWLPVGKRFIALAIGLFVIWMGGQILPHIA